MDDRVATPTPKPKTGITFLRMMFDEEYGKQKTNEWFEKNYPTKPYAELSDEEKRKRQTLAITVIIFVMIFFVILLWLLG